MKRKKEAWEREEGIKKGKKGGMEKKRKKGKGRERKYVRKM